MVAAGLHHTIARAFDNRTDYPDARREYERTVALYRQTDGELSQDAIIVQLQRVTLEARSYEKGSLDLAKSLLAEQENLLGRLARPRPELQVWRASARGMVALIDNRAKTAADEFELALKLASALPTFDESARLTLQQRLAFAYIRLGDGSRAETILRDLIAKFSDLTGSGSPNVLRVRLNLAQAFMIQNKHREAVEETTAIYPEFVSRLGPDHELTMQVLTTRAQSEGALGAWDDAIRDDLAIHDVAVRKQGPMSFFAVATLSDAALAMCRSGRTAEGTGNARRAYLASSKAFGPRAGLTGGTAATLATCLVGLGKLDEASKLLGDIDVPAVAQLAGDPDWGAGIKLLLAQIAYRRGQFDLARTFVREIAPVFSRPSAEAYQRQALQTLVGELAKQNVR